MAFVDPAEEAQALQGQAAQQAPIAAGGQGIGGSTKAASTPGVNVPAQPSAQLSAYLSANQPQAAAFGQNVASQVGGQINAAGQAIPAAVNTYTGNLYSVPTDASVNAAVASSPSSLTPEQKATYKSELGASSAAPNSASTFEMTPGYQDAASKVQGAVEQANLWNSANNPANLSTALAPYEGPNATAGVRTLDSLLLSQTPDAYKSIQSAVAPAAGLNDQLASGTSQADAALRSAIAQDLAATPAAQGAASNYVSGLNTTLAKYLSDAQAKADKYNAATGTATSNLAAVQPQISALQDAVAAYNSLVAKGQSAWGTPSDINGVPQTFSPITLDSYLSPSNTVGAPDISQVATPTQYSDIAALEALLGPGGVASLNPAIKSGDASKAGTWQDPGLPANLGQLLDPLFSSAIKGESPALNTLLQYSSGQNGTTSDEIQSDLNRAVFGTAGAALTLGAPPVGAALGAYFGGFGNDSTPTGNANVQSGSPIGISVKDIDNALTNLSIAEGNQPLTGTTPQPTPPAGLVPGTDAFNQWLLSAYPGLNIPTHGTIGVL